jgi:hypothetical protein
MLFLYEYVFIKRVYRITGFNDEQMINWTDIVSCYIMVKKKLVNINHGPMRIIGITISYTSFSILFRYSNNIMNIVLHKEYQNEKLQDFFLINHLWVICKGMHYS